MDHPLLIPELLEIVLVHLDMTTLLVAVQRVCKMWHQTISHSPALQQKLFFRPIAASELSAFRTMIGDEADAACALWPGQETSELDTTYGDVAEAACGPRPGQGTSKLVVNPLLVAKFGACFFNYGPSYGHFKRPDCFYTLPWSPNHSKLVPMETYGCYAARYRLESVGPLDEEAARLEAKCRARFTTRGASWRRMVVSQPPPPSIAYLEYHRDWSQLETIGTASVPPLTGEDVRMGQLYDMLQYGAAHHDTYSYFFRVLLEYPQAPSLSLESKRRIEEALRETSLLVEVYPQTDIVPWLGREPAIAADFDSAFRCDDFFHLDFHIERFGPSHRESGGMHHHYVHPNGYKWSDPRLKEWTPDLAE
ncbi:F-box domain protein [Metarhizium rileyi]|uniref:F-box domain protein n=1 Tax=Metarhizium rileyi (strain RCEF 4871) TaxID=1649241 RepID=A0A167AWL2_METRR|nr:F-box domain protein [Metarhizium rileyi RCEF 4871]